VDGADIANLGFPVTLSDKWWNDNKASGATRGQTFTTGSECVLLNAITYQIVSSQKAEPTKTYVIRVGTFSGSTFTEIYRETATQTFTWNASEYMTWAFNSPVFLWADSAYAIDVAMLSSTSDWPTGIPYLNTNGNTYAGGTYFTSGTLGVGTSAMNINASYDRVFHLDMAATEAPRLTLRVDPVTGAAAIIGHASKAISLSYYEITSAGNSLDAAHWISLADQDFEGHGPANGSGNGWEEAGGAGKPALAEAYLLGSSTIGASQVVSLGKGFDPAVDAEDLVFTYLTDDGKVVDGRVQYATSVAPGDADASGAVDAADYIALKQGFGKASGAKFREGDFDRDGNVDGADLAILTTNFGQVGAGATIPEPGSILVLTSGAAGLAMRRRRRGSCLWPQWQPSPPERGFPVESMFWQ
jgi:hypothetical protein